MSRPLASLVACALLGASGCYKATFIRDPSASAGAEHDRWVHFFVFGLVGDPTIDVHEFCPDGKVARVQTGANFGTGLVTGLTLGIYAPRKVYVTCAADAAGKVARLELTGDAQGRVVAAVEDNGGEELVASVTPGPKPGAFLVEVAP